MLSRISIQAPDGVAMLTLRKEHNERSFDPYDLLIEGICRQAAKDLRNKVPQYWRFDAMDFFRSRWFEWLTGLDGEEILQEILRR